MARGDDPHSTAYGTGDGDSRKSQSRRNSTAGICLYHVLLDSSLRIIGSAKPISISAVEPGRKQRRTLSEQSRSKSHKMGICFTHQTPTRLWFRVGFNSGVKDPSQGNGLDYQPLLHEAEEELAAAF